MKEKTYQRSASDSLLLDVDNSEPMDNENDSSGLEDNSDDEGSGNRSIDYKAKYKDLKRNVKILVYENVYFQNNLRASQRRLLKVTRDCSFLLDRLLAYERPELSSSDNDGTDSSDDSTKLEPTPKRRKTELSAMQSTAPLKTSSAQTKRTKKGNKKQQQSQQQQVPSHERPLPSTSYVSARVAPMPLMQPVEQLASSTNSRLTSSAQCAMVSHEEHLTKEEIERHLQSRQKLPEVVPEGELPSEMFNNSPSSESNDLSNEILPNTPGEDCVPVDHN